MCGILYAQLRQPLGESFAATFQAALKLIAYRGPDALGYSQQSNHYFGHARLSILDLSTRSNQPIIEKQHILLFKGEIYNYKKLVPHAPSDTLALAEMLENNIDITDKLCGMYGILTYHRQTQHITVLRDFYGEKPLYYYHDANIFIVSSTIKPIIHILDTAFNKTLSINLLSIQEYFLTGYIREPRTIYTDIHMLSSGHVLHFSPAWQLEIKNACKRIASNTTFNIEEHATHCFKTTDVEPALLLSSGVDSTYLLHLMQATTSNFRVLTYKAPHPPLDESAAAIHHLKKICKDKPVPIQVLENHADICQLYVNYPRLLEQPTSDGMNLLNLLTLSRQDNASQKLILLGTGGDELYGGYHSFTNFKKIQHLRKLRYLQHCFPQRYRRFFALPTVNALKVESYYFLYRLCPQFLPYVATATLQQLFTEFVQEMTKYQHGATQPYHKIKIFESFDYMRNQLLRDADNISLFCGYEARNPLLSIPAYHLQPDFKRQMKTQLQQQHGITFAPKRGFTFYENDQKISDFLHKGILEYNKDYALLPNKLIQALSSANTVANFSFMRKIYTLLAWLNANQISSRQLQGQIT